MTQEERLAKIAELKAAKEKKEQEKAARKAEREAARAARESGAKPARVEKEPVWTEQKDEHGNTELVDKTKNEHQIVCEDCGDIRWVTTSQLHEVTRCKPCARKVRRQRRAKRVAQRTKDFRAIVQEALELGLFPESFRKEHGLG